MALLTRSLIDSGLEMAAFGSSAPGGGSEHHISHCWEMRMLQAGQPALLHGLKVGVGTVIAAGWYARLREMSRDEAARRLANASLPDPEATEEIIRRVYGPVADQIIAQQGQFIRMSPERWSAVRQRVLDRWDDVQAVAARVPAPDAIAAALRSAGGTATAQELGLSEAEARMASRLRPLHPAALHHRQVAAAPGIVKKRVFRISCRGGFLHING